MKMSATDSVETLVVFAMLHDVNIPEERTLNFHVCALLMATFHMVNKLRGKILSACSLNRTKYVEVKASATRLSLVRSPAGFVCVSKLYVVYKHQE
jgi:hypothetical protein